MICDQCGRKLRARGECDGGCTQLAADPTCRFRRAQWRPYAIVDAGSVLRAIEGLGGTLPGGHRVAIGQAGRIRAPGARSRSPAPHVYVALAVGTEEPAIVDAALLRRALQELRSRRPIVVLAETDGGRTVGFEWGGDGRLGAYYLPACSDERAPRRTVTAAPAR